MKHTRSASLEVRHVMVHGATADLGKQDSQTTMPITQIPRSAELKVFYSNICPGCKGCSTWDTRSNEMQRAFHIFRQIYTCPACNKTTNEFRRGIHECSSRPFSETAMILCGTEDWEEYVKCEPTVVIKNGIHHIM